MEEISVEELLILENIIIILAASVLFYATRSPWAFLLLLFINTQIRGEGEEEGGKDDS